MANVVLTYKHDGEELSTGTLCRQVDGVREHPISFEKLSFAQMMARFAEMLCDYPDDSAVIHRNDRPGLKPFLLDAAAAELLRTDPVAAIRSMTYKPPVPKPENRRRIIPTQSGLIAGHDTLADGFGDRLYCRVRIPGKKGSADIECPGCGRWVAGHTPFVCLDCNTILHHLRVVSNRWAEVPTEEVLGLSCPRLFFPRAWNQGRNWISRDDLIVMYDQYKQEKERACSTPPK